MSVRDCMSSMSYMEYRAWCIRIQDEWNRPSRTDYYLMRVAYEISCLFQKSRPKMDFKRFIIKFVFDKRKNVTEQDRQDTIRNKTAIAKSIWKHRIGKK